MVLIPGAPEGGWLGLALRAETALLGSVAELVSDTVDSGVGVPSRVDTQDPEMSPIAARTAKD